MGGSSTGWGGGERFSSVGFGISLSAALEVGGANEKSKAAEL